MATGKPAIVASCWTYFTTIKHDARNHKYKKKVSTMICNIKMLLGWFFFPKNPTRSSAIIPRNSKPPCRIFSGATQILAHRFSRTE
jgi:hypothetical protein